MAAEDDENVLSSSSKLATYNMLLQEPTAKKIKLDGNKESFSKEVIKILPILGDEYLVSEDALGIVKGIAAKITSKQHTQEILKFLSDSLPLKNMAHVKRVRLKQKGESSLEILLVVLNDDTGGESHDELFRSTTLKNDVLKFFPVLDKYSEHLSDMFLCKVATKPPLTREQFYFAKTFWPVAFHEDKNISKMITCTNFSNHELENITNFCKMIEIDGNSSQDGRAIIIDPKNSTVIAQSVAMTTEKFDFLNLSKEFKHKLLHPVMVAIDLTAKSQGGGVYNYPSSDNLNWNKTLMSADSKSPPLGDSVKDDFYICTGYDAYVTFEPCVMCSMALLHSRIKRVFYLKPDQRCGALGGKYKLHAMRSLNHRFEVYHCNFTG